MGSVIYRQIQRETQRHSERERESGRETHAHTHTQRERERERERERTYLDRVVSVHKDLGLNDGDKSVILADGGVTGQSPGSLLDGVLGGAVLGDLRERERERER